MFVPANIRKISIASSFGVKYIPWYQIGRTRKYLNRIEFISMRENRGSEIVKELTGKMFQQYSILYFSLMQQNGKN